ncbi:MAG: DNA polymerase III subunit gamma/tau [Betaproteobacteria bacterium]|nr:DNA polymerase III subunit gamma/tau [Betaproteobacteria bacterium]
MSYQVLARKWRPRNFAALVGQEHVVRALRHALEQKRLHHAYLFTGTRGVGKTTLARILAKCLNCETGITAEPCGRCSACMEIDEGRFIDLLEVDAATNTRVDEMRQLLDTAQYAPTRGRFKVYVIDEVHMLSNSAFNAMLKTLEEPPEHLKFVLATTDPQKIPVTVLSRCLQFNLKQMPPAAIVEHLGKLLEAESIAFEPGALHLIGRAAAGSMRDALSLLDQAIAHGGGSVATEGVRDMLGAVDDTYLLRVLGAVAAGKGVEIMAIADEMQARSLSFDSALQSLAGLLLKLAVVHAAPDAAEASLPERDALAALAAQMDAEMVQLCYQIALQGREDLALAPDEHAGFIMTLLRMLAFRPEQSSTAVPGGSASASLPQDTVKGNSTAPRREFNGDWPSLIRQLAVGGAAGQLARNSALVRHAAGRIELAVPKSMAHLADRSYQEKLKGVLEQHFGGTLVLKVVAGEVAGATAAVLEAGEREARRAEAARAVQGDRFVQDLVDIFDAKVVGSSIKANGNQS